MSRREGVTLVEIIVSIVILSLILLGIAGLFVAGKRQLKRAQYKQEALSLAREKLEELEALDFDDGCLRGDCQSGCKYPPGPEGSCGDASLPYEEWRRTWTITDMDENFKPVDYDPQYKKITITVEWGEP